MKLLLDQGLGRQAAELLRARGHEAAHVGDLNLTTASDEEILATALDRGEVVVTLDHDFHDILARTGASAPSVILIRAPFPKSAGAAEALSSICERHETLLRDGAAVSVRGQLSRARPLPLRLRA